jgi:hypothetical protein
MTRASMLIAACLLAALAVAAACGGGEEGGPGGVELPEGFPQDFPLYAGAAVDVATVAPEGGRFLVSMETEDSADKVQAFYEKELGEDPWQVENIQEIPEMGTRIIAFTRRESPDQRGTVNIEAVHVDGQRTRVHLQVPVAP